MPYLKASVFSLCGSVKTENNNPHLIKEVYLHWSDLVNCTHVAVHAGLNKPSELFTATMLTESWSTYCSVHLLHPRCLHHTGKEIKIKNVSSPPVLDCVDNKDLIGIVEGGRGVAVWQWWPYISFSASVQTKLSGYRALRTVSRNSPILALLKAL